MPHRARAAIPHMCKCSSRNSAAERVTAIVSVQNRYNVADRSSEPVLDVCDQEMLVFGFFSRYLSS